jgi:DHA2 family multidrug resistance protein
MGLLFVPLTTLTMASIPAQETGYATSLYSVTRNIGSSMGISFVTTWVTRRSQFHQSILASRVTASNRMSQEALGQITGFLQHSGIDRVTAKHQAGALIYRTMQQQAALLSYVDVFRIMGFLFLVVIPLVFMMQRPHHHTQQH